jgi:hypothetical protein
MNNEKINQILLINKVKNTNIIYLYTLFSFFFSGLCYKFVLTNIDINILYFMLSIEKIIICIYLYKCIGTYNRFIILFIEKCINIFDITENTLDIIKS